MVRVPQSLVVCLVFCRSFFILSLLIIALSVLLFTTSDYPLSNVYVYTKAVDTINYYKFHKINGKGKRESFADFFCIESFLLLALFPSL